MSYRPLEACAELMLIDAVVDGLYEWLYDEFGAMAVEPAPHLLPTLRLAEGLKERLQDEVKRAYLANAPRVVIPEATGVSLAPAQGRTRGRTLADAEAARLLPIQDYGADT